MEMPGTTKFWLPDKVCQVVLGVLAKKEDCLYIELKQFIPGIALTQLPKA